MSASPGGRDEALARLRRRAAEVRARALTRHWEYRQRHHSKGVWFRLRRVLAETRGAFVISEGDARKLLDEGFRKEPIGTALFPQKTLIVVPPERAELIAERTAFPVRLGAEFLAARFLALVFWDQPREGD